MALCTFCGWNCNLAAAIFKMTLTQAVSIICIIHEICAQKQEQQNIWLQQKLRSLAIVSATAAGLAAGLSIYRGNEKFYEHVLMPATRYLPPEFSHQLAVWACKLRLFSGAAGADGACLVSKGFVACLEENKRFPTQCFMLSENGISWQNPN